MKLLLLVALGCSAMACGDGTDGGGAGGGGAGGGGASTSTTASGGECPGSYTITVITPTQGQTGVATDADVIYEYSAVPPDRWVAALRDGANLVDLLVTGPPVGTQEQMKLNPAVAEPGVTYEIQAGWLCGADHQPVMLMDLFFTTAATP
jgi:hypothetical protein